MRPAHRKNLTVPGPNQQTRHRGRRTRQIIVLAVLVGLWATLLPAAMAAETEHGSSAAQGGDERTGTYHTPLAGESVAATVLGHPMAIPGRDRRRITDFTLGGSMLDPRQGTISGLPIVAFFFRRENGPFRTRDLISIFENELEYDRRFGHFELVGHLENCTYLGDRTETINNHEIRMESIRWSSGINPAQRQR